MAVCPPSAAGFAGRKLESISLSSLRRFCGKLDHCEGIAVGPDGTVFAGGEAGQVYRISAQGSNITEIARTGGFCLGIAQDRAGDLFVCDMVWRAVIRVGQTGRLAVFADGGDGRKFRTPNFAVFDSAGNLYLSDSGEWKQNNGLIYRIAPNGQAHVFHPGPFMFANGLALNSTEDALFVIESNANRIARIEIRGDGTAGEVSVFCEGLLNVPDGMAFDSEGWLYVGCYGLNRLYAIDPSGKACLILEDTENATMSVPTNCAFGGADFDELYIACMGTGTIAVLPLGVRGMPLFGHGSGGG
jgi:gluconolactonase